MPHVVQGISDGVEVTFSSLLVSSVPKKVALF
jgi:hypothetical protein